jgi:poly-gamma-glutamate capsule biosynthesis protein CapA/YwtB (metallophosphatase superfamily)
MLNLCPQINYQTLFNQNQNKMGETTEILITGDFYGGYRIEELILNKKFIQLFNDFLPFIRNANIAITNLEAPLLKNGNPIKKTGPAIKAIPETIEAMKYAGFNLLTLANNHIMDFGAEGLLNTLKLCDENEISFIGAGENYQKASQTLYKEINDLKIAFINFTENEWSTTTNNIAGANPLNPIANYYKIQEAKALTDFVIVIVHGGHETYNLPSPRMKETYRFFVDAGADAVIGHHTHCYSGYEVYKGAPIFYSLGNFLFDSKTTRPESWHSGFAVRLFLSKIERPSFEIIPYLQSMHIVGVKILHDQEKVNFNNELEKLNAIIQDDNLLEKKFIDFMDGELAKTYRSFLEPISKKPLRLLQKLGVLPSLLSKKKRDYT